MQYKMPSPAEKAHDNKVRRVASDVAAGILALSDPVSDDQVLQVFQAQKCSPRVLCSAFWMMDNGTVRFDNYEVWHPRLRSVRNNPHAAPKMFALFD